MHTKKTAGRTVADITIMSAHAVERTEMKKVTMTYQVLFVCKHQYDTIKHKRVIYDCLHIINESN